jgi:hypothetical protein
MAIATYPILCPQMRCGASSTQYWSGDGMSQAAGAGTSLDEQSKAIIAVAGNVTALYVRQTTVVGTGTSVITLFKNGSSTAVTGTIASNGSSISVTGLSVAIAAGDKLSWQITNNSGGTLRSYSVSMVFTPTTTGDCMVWMGAVSFSAQTTFFSSTTGGGAAQTTSAAVEMVMPCAGTLDRLYVKTKTAMASGKTYVVTLFKNGSSTGVTCTIAALASEASDLSNSVSVVAGDTISWRGVHTDAFPSNTISLSMRFTPSGSRTGQPVFFYSSNSNPRQSGVADVYYPIHGNGAPVNHNTIGTTDPNDGSNAAPRATLPGVFYAQALYVKANAGPGASKTCPYTLRVTGVDSSLTCTLAGAGTGAGINTNNDITHSKTFAQGDQINMHGGPETSGATSTTSLTFSIAISDSDVVQTYNKTLSHIINFFQTLSAQGFITRSIVATTVTNIVGGGRQTIRTAAGAIWTSYYEGGSLKAAYTTDRGVTWTVTSVGPTWIPAGIAMCVGASDRPVLVVTRPSNDDFYVYQWSGTVWVLKKQLNEPIAQSESFQILYTGATYMLVFGYITSTSDRRVYSKTSTDLVTWATSVLLKDGDASGTGPQKFRRVAACLDASGNIHCCYSIRKSGTHNLYYRKYSGGAWGTEELIATGYGGNNIQDYQSGLSIAVDDLGYVHLLCRQRGATSTGSVQVVYYKRTTTWSTVEYVHSDIDSDQDFPSLSLNGRQPIACWASAGLGLGVTSARRGSTPVWVHTQITSNTRDSVQTIHGPSYGTSYNFSRGVAGQMRGSEEFFYSSDLIEGSAAVMFNTINFTSILSTQQRVLSNTITFSGVLSAIRGIGLFSTINFTSRLNFARQRDMASTIHFEQHLEGRAGSQDIYQTINITSTLSGVKSPIKDLAHTINFTSRLNRTITGAMANAIAFSGIVGVNIVKRQTISQSIAFVSRVTYNASLKKTMSSILNFIVGLVAMKADEGCQPSFTPERPLPTSEDDVNVVYLIGPLPSLSLTVQLKRPEYGNSRRQALQVKVNRTRGGKLRPHARTPTYEPQSISFESLSYLKLEQVRNFLRVCKGKKIYYLDEKNRKWIGYITSSDIDLSEETRDRGGQFTLEFEGTLAS